MKAKKDKMQKNETIHVCSNCNTRTELFFCPECGNIIAYPDFINNNDDLKESLSAFVSNMVATARKNKEEISSEIDKTTLANLVYRKYFQHIAFLQQLCSSEMGIQYFGGSGDDFFERMTRLGVKCQQHECQIAVVGTIKAGKSMFINALLDEEIASTYPTPETASVTKFRSSTHGDYVKVTYYDNKEWKELWNSAIKASENSRRTDNEDFLSEYKALSAELLKHSYLNKEAEIFRPKDIVELKQVVDKFTSARYAEHYFAKEVEIGLSKFKAPANVVFVDTPGLNDPVQFRSDITRRYLHSANVILLCVAAESAELRSDELEQIAGLFAELRYRKDRVYLLGTKVDVPYELLKYWEEYTFPNFIKHLSKEMYFGDRKTAIRQTHPISAYYYNLIKLALKDPESWHKKEYKGQLKEMVRRNFLDLQDKDELEDLYGEEEAKKRYISPQKAFYERTSELESMTNIPQVRELLMNEPVKNAERIILDDIASDYSFLCKQISCVSTDVQDLHKGLLSHYADKDVHEKIQLLNANIQQSNKEYENLKKVLSDALSSLQNQTGNIINDNKNK